MKATKHVKHLDESLRHFIKRKGGINECTARFARRHWKEIDRIGPQHLGTAVAQVLHRLSHGKNALDLTQHSSGAVGPSAIAAQQE